MRVVRENVAFTVLLGLGVVLRVLTMIAYPHVFLYQDSVRYYDFSYGWKPDYVRQAGYSLFLKVLRHIGPVPLLTFVQHLLALAAAVGLYALLRRRSVPTWLSLVAVGPVLFDGLGVTVDHYMLAEALFTALIVGGLLALLWPRRPGPLAAGVAGLLLAGSAATRLVSLPLILVAVGYLLIRRAGWRPVTAFVLGVGLPLAGYAVWYHGTYGQYGFSGFQGAFLYGRVAPTVRCETLDIRPELRKLCPTQPVSARPANDWYIWSEQSPARQAGSDAELREFASAAIRQQPGPLAWAILLDFGKYLIPHRTPADAVCVEKAMLLPAEPPHKSFDWCRPNPRQAYSPKYTPESMPGTTPLTRALGWYADVVRTPRLLLLASVALVMVALVWRPRRRRAPIADLLLLGGWGVGLLGLAVAGSMFDERYGVPVLPLLPVAGALALASLLPRRDPAIPTQRGPVAANDPTASIVVDV